MTRDEAQRILRDPSADPLEQYDAHKLLAEPDPEPERVLDTLSREQDWTAWNNWADERVRSALVVERESMTQIVAEALALYTAAEVKKLRREFSKQLRNLESRLASAEAAISELRSILVTERNTPVEMPARPAELA